MLFLSSNVRFYSIHLNTTFKYIAYFSMFENNFLLKNKLKCIEFKFIKN